MEHINCPICGKDTTKLLFNKGNIGNEIKDLTNVICKQCALVYINPRPSNEEILKLQVEPGASGHHTTVAEKINPTEDHIKNSVAQFLSNVIKPNFKILDIGCGFGVLPRIIQQKHPGIIVEGIELNKNDVDAAKTLFNLDVFHGTLEQFHYQYKSRQYDLIILHHTFEHFADPLAELGRIKDLLATDGLLYIAVPNILNMKKRPEIFFQLGHTFSYSPASLTKMLNRGGFKITIFNEHADYPGGMECLAQKISSSTPALQDHVLDRGHNPSDVISYVTSRAKNFNLLRDLRDKLLFFLPASWRIAIGRKVYLMLKKRK